MALSLQSQAAQRDLGSGPGAEACWDSLRGVLAFQWLGNPLWPGGGRRFPESVLAALPPQHFLILSPNNNSHSCSHSDKPCPPGLAHGRQHMTATPASLSPPLALREGGEAGGVGGDDVDTVVSMDIMHRRQRRPVFGVQCSSVSTATSGGQTPGPSNRLLIGPRLPKAELCLSHPLYSVAVLVVCLPLVYFSNRSWKPRSRSFAKDEIQEEMCSTCSLRLPITA